MYSDRRWINQLMALSLVEKTSRELGLKEVAHETFRAGVASPCRWLRRLGLAGIV